MDLAASWLAGDKLNDMQAAKNADLASGLHVLTGHGRSERVKSLQGRDRSTSQYHRARSAMDRRRFDLSGLAEREAQ